MDFPDAELSIVVTDDAAIRELNRVWRGKDEATDVLSFPQHGAPAAGLPLLLGDVVISIETAARQADDLGHCLDDEVQRLLVHGILHLLGHDHVHGGAQARRMKREEARLWRLLGAKPEKRRRPRLTAPSRSRQRGPRSSATE